MTSFSNSRASSVEAYEDMFKEITRKLYGEEATTAASVSDAERLFKNVLSDRISTSGDFDQSVGIDSPKSDEHLTAFGLALMQNGFSTSNAILGSHTFQQINKQNPTNSSTTQSVISFPGNIDSVLGKHNASTGTVLQKSMENENEIKAWNHKCETFQNTQKPFKSKKQELRENVMLHSLNNQLINEPIKSTNGMNSNNRGSAIQPVRQILQKRYSCSHCSYSSDRRDLFTRHENIHKEDKPFHCYVCSKMFNRADHVKKHFLRMHRGLNYDISRTKRSLPQEKPEKNVSSGSAYYNQTNHAHEHTHSGPNIPTAFHSVLQYQQMEQPSQLSIIDQTCQHLSNVFQTSTGSTANQQSQSQQLSVKVEKNSDTTTKKGDKRFMCCYCSWSGNDNWGLKRHLNTHTKPFVCFLCDYKAARSERLATHVFKVHNKKVCTKCNFLAENQIEYNNHVNEAHANETKSQRSVPVTNSSDSKSVSNNILSNVNNSFSGNHSFNTTQDTSPSHTFNNWRSMMGSTSIASPNVATPNGNNSNNQKRGAERLFQYLDFGEYCEAEDSDPEDYARQMAIFSEISRNTSSVAQDFHNAGGRKNEQVTQLHIYGNSEPKLINEFISTIDVKVCSANVTPNQGSIIRQTILPPANQMKQFGQDDKENKLSSPSRIFDAMPCNNFDYYIQFLRTADSSSTDKCSKTMITV